MTDNIINFLILRLALSKIAFAIVIVFALISIYITMDDGLMSNTYNNNSDDLSRSSRGRCVEIDNADVNNNVGVDKNNDVGIGTNIGTLNKPNVNNYEFQNFGGLIPNINNQLTDPSLGGGNQKYNMQPREQQQQQQRQQQQQQQRQQQQIHDQIIQLHKLQQQSEEILKNSGLGDLFDGIFDPVTLALTAGAFTTTTTTAAAATATANQGNNNNAVLGQQQQITTTYGTPTPATASMLSPQVNVLQNMEMMPGFRSQIQQQQPCIGNNSDGTLNSHHHHHQQQLHHQKYQQNMAAAVTESVNNNNFKEIGIVDNDDDTNNLSTARKGTQNDTRLLSFENIKQHGSNDGATNKKGRQRTPNTKKSFPKQLWDAMTGHSNREDAFEWLPDGKSFVIVNWDIFCNYILDKTLKASKYGSFVRKLHRWGFVRLTSGTGTDCFHHPLFQLARGELVKNIVSSVTKVNEGKDDNKLL